MKKFEEKCYEYYFDLFPKTNRKGIKKFRIAKRNGWTILNEEGYEICEPKYNYIKNWYFGNPIYELFLAKRFNGSYTFIDTNGNELLKHENIVGIDCCSKHNAVIISYFLKETNKRIDNLNIHYGDRNDELNKYNIRDLYKKQALYSLRERKFLTGFDYTFISNGKEYPYFCKDKFLVYDKMKNKEKYKWGYMNENGKELIHNINYLDLMEHDFEFKNHKNLFLNKIINRMI